MKVNVWAGMCGAVLAAAMGVSAVQGAVYGNAMLSVPNNWQNEFKFNTVTLENGQTLTAGMWNVHNESGFWPESVTPSGTSSSYLFFTLNPTIPVTKSGDWKASGRDSRLFTTYTGTYDWNEAALATAQSTYWENRSDILKVLIYIGDAYQSANLAYIKESVVGAQLAIWSIMNPDWAPTSTSAGYTKATEILAAIQNQPLLSDAYDGKFYVYTNGRVGNGSAAPDLIAFPCYYTPPEAEYIPEPASLSLLGLGLAGLMIRRK